MVGSRTGVQIRERFLPILEGFFDRALECLDRCAGVFLEKHLSLLTTVVAAAELRKWKKYQADEQSGNVARRGVASLVYDPLLRNVQMDAVDTPQQCGGNQANKQRISAENLHG